MTTPEGPLVADAPTIGALGALIMLVGPERYAIAYKMFDGRPQLWICELCVECMADHKLHMRPMTEN